jgi:NAD(P)-dependent dehydrogenase (short-subunit alcohol dehydrogenase family)
MSVDGKRILVTGATDGIGLEAAVRLAAMGASLHLVGRNPEKLGRAADKVAAAGGGKPPATYLADLSSQMAIRALAAEVTANAPKLDILLNNAGGYFSERRLTADGIEMTFGFNHLGYFLLTHLLLGALHAAPRGRVVNVASDAHKGASLDFDNLQGERKYSGWGAYQRSKLANILFTRELATRLDPKQVTVNCLHPGFVASNFAGSEKGGIAWAIGVAKNILAISVENGAKTSIYLASSDEVTDMTGGYFVKSKLATPSRQAQDMAAQKQLWAVSERLTGIMP